MPEPRSVIKDVLDSLLEKYSKKKYLESDPVQFLHRYDDERDVEVVGFLASAFAFGMVRKINEIVEGILERMGRSPYRFVKAFDGAKDGRKFKGFKYRFINDTDLLLFLNYTRRILEESPSIENFFSKGYGKGRGVRAGLISFVERTFRAGRLKGCALPDKFTRGLRFLLPDPKAGSACKRLNLFLRWMVRRDEIDVGLWKTVATSDLIVPLDTHMANVSRWIGLTRLKSPGWAMAESITDALKTFDPDDPVKYDFALTRPGIMNGCRIGSAACRRCDLKRICLTGTC